MLPQRIQGLSLVVVVGRVFVVNTIVVLPPFIDRGRTLATSGRCLSREIYAEIYPWGMATAGR